MTGIRTSDAKVASPTGEERNDGRGGEGKRDGRKGRMPLSEILNTPLTVSQRVGV